MDGVSSNRTVNSNTEIIERLKVCLNDSALVNGFGISCGVDRQHDWYDD